MKGKEGILLGDAGKAGALVWNQEFNVSLCFIISISENLTALLTVSGIKFFSPVCAKGLHNAACGLKCVQTFRSLELTNLIFIFKCTEI